jgi:serine protease AprX
MHRSFGSRTRRVALVLAALGLFSAAPLTAADAATLGTSVPVIVRSASGEVAARAAVQAVGGEITKELPIVDGVVADVPQSALASLRRNPGLRVSLDGHVGFDSTDDFNLSPQRVQTITRSTNLWNEGLTGKGVTVALLDTGVYNHPDLAGRVIHCEDFSAEAGTAANCADTFGHGTFMAGLIAGNGTASGGKYKGSAPEANIVSVKLAGFDGSTDVSNVLGGIQWVVSHRTQYNIRVMNLSLGSDSSQSYLLSPLNYAVERAWKAGIAVVVSAGNSGAGPKTILKPADDPYVITVGASNDEGTLTVSDDHVPTFSSRGPTRSNGVAKPDLVAPGVHTISLRSPGSAIDQAYGSTATVANNYFRGTGTSMSAAVVTGAVAQMLQAHPSLTPDQVKYRLTATARPIAETNKYAAGTGILDAYAAAHSTSTASANGGLLLGLGNGLGSLDADRGTLDLTVNSPVGSASLDGEFKAQFDPSAISLSNVLGLVPWTSVTYTTLGWDPLTWDATSWKNNAWDATSWKATSWKETFWDATSWKGTLWQNADWDATSWKNTDWDATSWKATSWKSAWYAAAWD